MKLLCLLLMSGLALAAEPPKAKVFDLSKVSRADIIATVKHLQKLTDDSIAKARAIETKLAAADLKAVGVQGIIDTQADTIKKQAASLVRWKAFGQFWMIAMFWVAFAAAWLLIGKMDPGFLKNPTGIWIRIGICVAAGALASGGIFRIITKVL